MVRKPSACKDWIAATDELHTAGLPAKITLAAADNGDLSSHEPFQATQRHAF